MVWLGLGTQTTWLGLGKDLVLSEILVVVTTNKAGQCLNSCEKNTHFSQLKQEAHKLFDSGSLKAT